MRHRYITIRVTSPRPPFKTVKKVTRVQDESDWRSPREFAEQLFPFVNPLNISAEASVWQGKE